MKTLVKWAFRMLWSISKLDKNELESVKSLEEKLGVNLLAFSSIDVEPAELTEKELEKIKRLEEELKISLIAVGEKED